MKRIAAISLALAQLAMLSCGAEETGNSGEGVNPTDPSETTTASALSDYTPPEIDFGGYEFRMLTPLETEYYENTEISGDVVSDAVYSVNRKVEELYNIEFKLNSMGTTWGEKDAFMDHVRSSVLADDDAYDVVFPLYYFGEQLAVEGYFLDFNKIDSVNLDADWWVSGYNDQAELYGKLFGAVGDYSLSDLDNQTLLYFNKRIHAEYQFENLYDLVRAGEWTLDKFFTMVSGVGRDLDNNEIRDEKDFYGYICNEHGARTFTVNSGIKYMSLDSDGNPYISLASEKTFDLYERLYAFLNKSDDTYYEHHFDGIVPIFMQGRALFMTAMLGESARMREMDDDFGMIPQPKYDEKQESYITWSVGPSLACIPRTADNPERTGAVLDALNFYTHTDVLPVYYEVALKSKYARDNDTAEMLDIVRDGTYYDIGFIYSLMANAVADTFGNSLVHYNVENFASQYAKDEALHKSELAEMLEAYKKLS